MSEALFLVILTNIAKINLNKIQYQTGQQKIYSKKILNIFWKLYRLITPQKNLNPLNSK